MFLTEHLKLTFLPHRYTRVHTKVPVVIIMPIWLFKCSLRKQIRKNKASLFERIEAFFLLCYSSWIRSWLEDERQYKIFVETIGNFIWFVWLTFWQNRNLTTDNRNLKSSSTDSSWFKVLARKTNTADMHT